MVEFVGVLAGDFDGLDDDDDDGVNSDMTSGEPVKAYCRELDDVLDALVFLGSFRPFLFAICSAPIFFFAMSGAHPKVPEETELVSRRAELGGAAAAEDAAEERLRDAYRCRVAVHNVVDLSRHAIARYFQDPVGFAGRVENDGHRERVPLAFAHGHATPFFVPNIVPL